MKCLKTGLRFVYLSFPNEIYKGDLFILDDDRLLIKGIPHGFIKGTVDDADLLVISAVPVITEGYEYGQIELHSFRAADELKEFMKKWNPVEAPLFGEMQ